MTAPETSAGRRSHSARTPASTREGLAIRSRRWLKLRSYLPFPVGALPFFALLIPLYLWIGLGNHDLWAPDEPRYALAAHEMRERGAYALPTVNGETYAHKPPLLFWMIATLAKITGQDASHPFIARLPSALAAIGSLILTVLIGSWYFGTRAGILSGLILATSLQFCVEAHTAQIDSLLTFWIVFAIFHLVLFHRTGEPRFAYAFHLSCAMGTLAKGPPGFLIPWAVAFLTHSGRSLDRRNSKGIASPAAVMLWVGPVVLWLALATRSGGVAYIYELLGKHVVQRALASWHHIHPWYYFLLEVPKNMVPWSSFFPAAFIFALQNRKDPELRDGIRLTMAWAGFMLLMFSIPGGKRGVYMLPSLPPLSMLIAACLVRNDRTEEDEERGDVWMNRLLPFGFALATLFLFYAFFKIPQELSKDIGDRAPPATVLRAALMVGAAFLGIAWLKPRVRRLTQATLVSALLMHLALWGTMIPDLNTHKSARPLALRAVSRLTDGEELGFYGTLLEAYVLYSRQRLLVAEDQRELINLLQSHPKVLLIMQRERMKDLAVLKEIDVETVEDQRVGSKDMVLARVRLLAH